MEEGNSETVELLRRWHAGDREALDRLLARDLPWIEKVVHRRLGSLLRAKAETHDLVQEVVMEFLEYGPRVLLASRQHFRALLARIAENVIRGQYDWYTAQRRSIHRERPLPADSVLHLAGPRDDAPGPGQVVEEKEWQSLVRLGLELLEAGDREVILLREWEKYSFVEIGRLLGVSSDAARMRFHRAVARLAGVVDRVRAGRLAELLERSGEEGADPGGGP